MAQGTSRRLKQAWPHTTNPDTKHPYVIMTTSPAKAATGIASPAMKKQGQQKPTRAGVRCETEQSRAYILGTTGSDNTWAKLGPKQRVRRNLELTDTVVVY